MAYCRNCGQQIDESAQTCPYCGASQNLTPPGVNVSAPAQPTPSVPIQEAQQPQPVVQPPMYSQQPNQQFSQNQQPSYQIQNVPIQNPDDSGSFGWAILGFCIPLVGLILFLVWHDTKPKCAKKAGIGALVSVIVGLLLTLLTTCIGIGSISYIADMY